MTARTTRGARKKAPTLVRGPVTDEAYALCVYCPSLCRHACPVATADGGDALTPQRLMSLAAHVQSGKVAPSPEVVLALHGCAGCGACSSACLYENPVADALVATRAGLCEAGESPLESAQLTRADVSLDHAFFEGVRQMSRWDPKPTTVYLPGHRQMIERPADALELLTICERLDVDAVACGELTRIDPGYDLWFFGHHRAFEAQARRFVAAAQGATDIVVGSPEDLHLLRHVYPRHGLALPASIVHTSELLLPVLSGAIVNRLSDRVVYHESCHLARHCGLTDVPRQVVRRALAGALLELPARADVTGCCGGTGLRPLYAETASVMAGQVLDAARSKGATRLVTFSSECVASFQAARAERQSAGADPGPEVEHVLALLARAVVPNGLG